MSIYLIWPYFLVMAILLAVASTRFFAAADIPPNPKPDRVLTLDGLRGFLALGVFFQHAMIYVRFLQHGVWDLPPLTFYVMLPECSVALFFIITGYLFWSLLIKKDGRPNWLSLYINRVFRIAPLYLCAVLFMFIYIFRQSGWHINVSEFVLFKQICQALMLGLYRLGDINNFHGSYTLVAGVLWTLHYEWLFYLSLPLLACFARSRKMHLPFVAGSLCVVLAYVILHPTISVSVTDASCALLFLTGMACASLQQNGFIIEWPDRLKSAIATLILIAVFTLFHAPDNAGLQAIAFVLLGAVFFLVICGCTFFGLLTSAPARRLGNVSYGIYILQGAVLRLVFLHPALQAFALSSPMHYWTIVLINGLLLITVATIAHILIERPAIDLGKAFYKKIFD